MTITKHLNSRGGLLAIAALALATASPTFAGSLTGPDVVVSYSDLNLDSVDGATTLLKRIRVAADNVCAPLNHGNISSRANVDKCNAKLTDAAVTKVNHPVVASVYKAAHRNASSVAALAD
jgi:UrcA family protein